MDTSIRVEEHRRRRHSSTGENAKQRALGTDGQRCTRETGGLLHRRPVRDLTIRHIGKEANELEDLTAGLRSGEQVTAASTRNSSCKPSALSPSP